MSLPTITSPWAQTQLWSQTPFESPAQLWPDQDWAHLPAVLCCAGDDRDLAAELSRLTAEGLLRPVIADVLVATDVPDSLDLRARAVALAIATRTPGHQSDGRLTAGYATAAWVHTGGPTTPTILDLIISPGRSRPRPSAAVFLHEHRLLPSSIVHVAGAHVTSPVRTAADLARSLPSDDVPVYLDLLRGHCGITARQVLACLNAMPRQRGVVAARAHVKAWARR